MTTEQNHLGSLGMFGLLHVFCSRVQRLYLKQMDCEMDYVYA